MIVEVRQCTGLAQGWGPVQQGQGHAATDLGRPEEVRRRKPGQSSEVI